MKKVKVLSNNLMVNFKKVAVGDVVNMTDSVAEACEKAGQVEIMEHDVVVPRLEKKAKKAKVKPEPQDEVDTESESEDEADVEPQTEFVTNDVVDLDNLSIAELEQFAVQQGLEVTRHASEKKADFLKRVKDAYQAIQE